MNTEGDYVIASIAISIAIFLALREVFCWYWKINAIKDKVDKQTELLTEIRDALQKDK